MGTIDNLINQIEDDEWHDETQRVAVDLSDVKRWVKYALQTVKTDLEEIEAKMTPPQKPSKEQEQ